jgi:hypothetical protein
MGRGENVRGPCADEAKGGLKYLLYIRDPSSEERIRMAFTEKRDIKGAMVARSEGVRIWREIVVDVVRCGDVENVSCVCVLVTFV